MSMKTESVVARLKASGLFQTKGLIGGKWIDAYDGNTFQVKNPATGEVIASVACMGERETKDAISSAYHAFHYWSKLTAADRSSRLRKCFVEFFAEEGKHVYGDIILSPLPDRRLFVLKQPVGVVGAITPWNFPLAMITRKVSPALACGCTVVIKPSELTPLTALAAAELAIQSGIPPGVLNVVMGDAPSIGNSLLESPQVRKLTFTGSTAVGKKLMAGAAETVKKVSLELGGNAPSIIFDDADLEVALKQSLAAKVRNCGQACISIKRLLVQEGIYEKFINAFSTAIQSLEVGNGFSEGVAQGPLINEAAVQKVESLVQDAISKGARVLVGGKRHSLGMTFYEPTILVDVKNEMLIARQEIFGPVAPVIQFKTEEEAIQIANDTHSGLAAYVFTHGSQRLWRVSEALEYGIVEVNDEMYTTEMTPFGGFEQSGLGREGSKYGLDEFLEMSTQMASVVARLRSCGLLRAKGLIGGKWTHAYDRRTMEVNNPASGEVIASVACMGERETKDAISAAYDAFSHWSRLTAADRSIRLRNWYNLLIAHKEELGQLITLEQGKPLKEAIEEVGYGSSFIEFFAEEAKRVYGDIIPSPLRDRRLIVLKQPVGVVGAITPWNFPLAMITRKVGPALACGCTVVIKPSELTPLTALATAELAIQSGIPPGVLNVVMGDAPIIGNSILESPQVKKITFTGSTAVGKKLMAGASETVKKVSLELGGNAPCIIFDDADLEVAVKQSLVTKFGNTGQVCICTNRLLVQEGIYGKFINAFSTAVQNIKVGNGFTEGVTQGPLINEAAVQKVESFVQDAISKGAKVLVGGKRHRLGMTFYEPTILSDVKNEMLIARQEVFGPVAPIIQFKTEEEAIQLANDTNSGLVAYIFTNSIRRSWRVSESLEYGMVGVNEGWISTEVAPFGGSKESGLGREGSKYGLDDYLEIKYLCMGNMG